MKNIGHSGKKKGRIYILPFFDRNEKRLVVIDIVSPQSQKSGSTLQH